MKKICGWHSTQNPDFGRTLSPLLDASLSYGDVLSTADARSGHLAASDSRTRTASNEACAVAICGNPRLSEESAEAPPQGDECATAILRAYDRNGIDFLKNLKGSFALALIDDRKEELILAIDRMGVQSLCYSLQDGIAVFGSDTTSVLASGVTDSSLSSDALYHYVYFHVVPSPITIFSAIRKLEPGQFVRIRRGQAIPDFYWKPDFREHCEIPRDELEEQVRACLRAAVRKSIPKDSFGCFLSGGLDSSTICGIANEISDSRLRAYCIGFEQDSYDEMEYARLAANHFNFDLVEHYVQPEDIARQVTQIATAYDEPFGNSSAIPSFFCAQRAADDGIQCLLAGDGGDELFAGNERYVRQQIFETYYKVPGWLRQNLIEPVFEHVPTDWSNLTRKARRYIEQARVPMPQRLQTYNLLQILSPDSVFDEQFLQKIDAGSVVMATTDWYRRNVDASFLNRMLAFDWKLTLADNDLRKINTTSSLAGIDVAFPMLDDDLVELSTRIPSSLKIRRQELRYFFKRTYADFLPESIINKTKHGFGLPFGEWLATSPELRDITMSSLDSLRRRDLFKKSFIDDLIAKHRDEHAAFYGGTMWVLMMLDMWLTGTTDRRQASSDSGLRPAEIQATTSCLSK